MKYFFPALLILIATSLAAQSVYIPYKAGGKWGLADSTGKIVLTPQYDTLEYNEYAYYQGKGMFFTSVSTNRRGLIYNSKPLLQPVYDNIFINRHFLFCSNSEGEQKNIFLHNLKGQLLNPKPFKGFNQLYHGYDNYEQTMMTVKFAENRFDLIYIDNTGKLLTLLRNQQRIEYDGNSVEAIEKSGGSIKMYTILSSAKGILSLRLLSKETEERALLQGAPVYDLAAPVMDMGYNQGQSYRFTQAGRELKSYSNYSVNNIDFKWNQYDTVFVFPAEYNSIYSKNSEGQTRRYENALFTRKDGKYGIVFPDGKQIPTNYDTISFFRSGPANNFLKYLDKTQFLVKKEGKYGVVGVDGAVIIPAEYDSISPELIVKKGNSYGVLQTDATIQLPLIYDAIEFDRSKQLYQLRSKEKYGLYYFVADKNERILLDCNSPWPLKGWQSFKEHHPTAPSIIVFEAYDNGKFLGYYDRKGFAYFK